MADDKTKPSIKICFAVLLHNKREIAQDMLDNIRVYCPNSSVVLYNGGMDPALCNNLGYPVCPTSRKLNWGLTAIYMLEVMEWLEQIGFEYDYLINLDSDALFLREGYETFIEQAMKDADYMGVDVFIRDRNWFCGVQLRKEWKLWEPLLLTNKFLGAFNVGQVFSRRYIQRLLTYVQFKQLKWNLLHTKALGVDEIVYVMMAERIGFKPKSYPMETGRAVRYRPHYKYREIIDLINKNPHSYLLHPVKRNMKDEARALIRSLMWKAWCERGYSSMYHFGNISHAKDILGSPGIIRTYDTLEMVAPLSYGELGHWRNTYSETGSLWSGPITFRSGRWKAVSMIRSSNGNLEFIARRGERLVHFYGVQQDKLTWYKNPSFASAVLGTPFLMENHNGNFEVIAPLKKGGIGHWWGNDRHRMKRWHGPTVFGRGKADVVSLISTNEGKLVAVLEKKGRLISYIRAGNGRWELSESYE
jgi:hypothetical protein